MYFHTATTQIAALKAANRALSKLSGNGLITALARRVGGVRAGSSSYVWQLTAAGARLLDLKCDKSIRARQRTYETSPQHFWHILAVSETYIQIIGICRKLGIELLTATPEPNCWRSYRDADGKEFILKPDLFIKTATTEFEDSFFFEVDLASEAPVRVLKKCRRYQGYYKSGKEQKASGVFPYVIWLVPDGKRKDSLKRHISEEYSTSPEIFIVIAPEDLEALFRKGTDSFRIRKDESKEIGGKI